MKDIEYYIELSQSPSMNKRLCTILDKIENSDFDTLETSDYIFMIRMYIGKLASSYGEYTNDRTLFIARINRLLKRYNLSIEDYTKNDYSTVLDSAREVARKLIKFYRTNIWE